MIDEVKKWVGAITEIGIAILALAIVASLLFGAQNMMGLGNVAGNIIALVKSFGDAGLAGLLSLFIVASIVTRRS
jgi:hypothetical protein